jgi:hypothetical protein
MWLDFQDERERQLVLLALARLAVERPGAEDALLKIAQQLQGETMFREYQRLKRIEAYTGPRNDG